MPTFLRILFALGQVWASTPFKQALTMKMNNYLSDGVFVGGTAGPGASILGVRRIYSAKVNVERMVVEMGDKEAKPAKSKVSYFQASVDGAENRVVLSVVRLNYSKVSEQQLRNLFRTSPNVKAADFTLDPEDKTGIIVLKFKHPMRLEVFQSLDRKGGASVVLDMTPAKNTHLRNHI